MPVQQVPLDGVRTRVQPGLGQLPTQSQYLGGLPWSAEWATVRAPSTNDYRRTQIPH
ncbi:hypothetical protein [Kribbella steppae]|uniref:hypothetical protein n=1 Tax=Kribbella steppae TaxID=2512223 RepID=UPI00130D9148|nr:hypothetical protein [Kribbella steppae]